MSQHLELRSLWSFSDSRGLVVLFHQTVVEKIQLAGVSAELFRSTAIRVYSVNEFG